MKPNAKQQKWMKRVEKLLLNPPEGIGIYTTGDRRLLVYDLNKENSIHAKMDRGCGMDFCCAVDELDAELGVIYTHMNIHSTAA